MTDGLIDHLEPHFADERVIALATLVAATGSTSKKVGTKMIVGESGRLIGGVTIGGCVDAQVVEAADALLERGGRRVLSISLDDDEAWEIGLTCGGTVDVLIERVDVHDVAHPVAGAHAAARAMLARGETVVIASPLDGDAAAMVLSESGERHGTLGGATLDEAAMTIAGDVLVSGSRIAPIDAAGASRQFFFDRQSPPTTIVIVGAGQIAMSLTRIARELDMRTIVVDGRDRYATRERFPDADEIRVGMPSEIIASIDPSKRVAVVLIAHDYKYELPALRLLLRSPVGYVGMLGSKKRGESVRALLREEGFTVDELARIHSPIGLDIGGKTPPEVALSILAELVAVRSGKRA
jgi:xanthine dehydrogenase accessory factor